MDIAADDIGTGLHKGCGIRRAASERAEHGAEIHKGAGLTGLPPGRPDNGRHSP
jgi:hypothetical protein